VFIELTDILRCPRPHEEAFLVLAPVVMEQRRVVAGVLGCPVCGAEYPIEDAVARFDRASGPPPEPTEPPGPARAAPAYEADALLAFLDLQGAGGYVCLVGGAARHAAPLAERAPGVHVVAVNPPAGVAPAAMVSLLRSPVTVPIKRRQVRAVALGADHTTRGWIEEARRILLPGLRLLVEDEAAEPAGITPLARGGGLLVAVRNAD
jgi:uncharacterized protein YbaR (Trm112 family)